MTITRLSTIALLVCAVPLALRAQQPTVRVEPSNLNGPRPLEDQTATAVVRDYLESWQSLRSALLQNRPALLNPDFVGVARDKLTDTIHQQARAGMQTRYRDRSHDLHIVFYSPDGLSVQMTDNVEYDERVLDHGKLLASHRVHGRCIVILTPAEQRWRVRVFQAQPM